MFYHLHDSQHASNKCVSNAGFVCFFSLSPIPEIKNKMPGEFLKKTANIIQFMFYRL